MVIIAWSPSGSPSSLFDPDVFKNVTSIFITAALLNFLQGTKIFFYFQQVIILYYHLMSFNYAATLDIILSWKAWGSMKYNQIIRFFLKFLVASMWLVVLPIGYSSSVQNPSGLVRSFSNWVGNWQSQSFYSLAVIIYLLPNIFSALFFVVPPLRKSVERSNWHFITLLLWWAQASVTFRLLPIIMCNTFKLEGTHFFLFNL